MPTITAGTSRDIWLTNSQQIVITTLGNIEALITQAATVPSIADQTKQTRIGPMATTKTMGPFGCLTKLTIAPTGGSLDYAVTGTSNVVIPAGGQCAIPSILVPSGSIAASGAITLGTALSLIYPNAWIYLPAGAIVGGAAGMYYATFSSTTVGSVKTDFVDSTTAAFTAYIPTSPVAAVGAGAYAQTTGSDIPLANVTIPGGLMGPNGKGKLMQRWAHAQTAGNKTPKNLLGGSNFASTTVTTSSCTFGQSTFDNRGAENSQLIASTGSINNFNSAGGASLGSTFASLAINTVVDQAVKLTANIAVATDFLMIESFSLEVIPA